MYSCKFNVFVNDVTSVGPCPGRVGAAATTRCVGVASTRPSDRIGARIVSRFFLDIFHPFLPVFSPFSPRFPVLFVFSEGKVGKAELDLVIEVVARNSVLLFSHLIPSWCFIFVSDRAFKSCLFKSYSLAWKWRGRSAVQAARLILIMLVYSGLCWSRCLPFDFLMVTHVPVSQDCLKRLQATTEISWAGTKHLCGRSFFETQRWVNIESTLNQHWVAIGAEGPHRTPTRHCEFRSRVGACPSTSRA